MSKRLIVGLDNGFGQVKAVTSDGRTCKFPSFYAKAAPSLGVIPDQSLVKLPSGDYIVGEAARDLGEKASTPGIDSSWINQPGFQAFALHAFDLLGVKSGLLITGLSIEYYSYMQDRLKAVVRGWADQGYNFNLISTEAQPTGSFWNACLDDNGNFVRAVEQARVGVVDIGAGTLDLVELNKCDLTQRYKSNPFGVSSAYRDLFLHIMEKHTEGKRMVDMPEAMASGVIKVDGKPVDISREVQRIKKRYAMWVHYSMREAWPQLEVLDIILVTGGGASLIKEDLLNLLDRPADSVLIPEHSDMANAKGYVKYALAMNTPGTMNEAETQHG
jgi:hypothetical protein